MARCEIVFTDLLIEFLEVAFNNILYARKLYPAEVFVGKKIYSTVAYISQHPELNEYMENVLKTIRGWLAMDSSSVSAINMKFFDKDQRLVEKYVFNLMDMDKENLSRRDCYYTETEQLLRSLTLKITMAISYLDPLPEESTFSIDVDARRWTYVALCENSISQNFAWILNSNSSVSPSEACNENSLLPLMDIKNSCLHLQLYVLRMNNKLKTLS